MVVCKQCRKTIVNVGNPATIYSICTDCNNLEQEDTEDKA